MFIPSLVTFVQVHHPSPSPLYNLEFLMFIFGIHNIFTCFCLALTKSGKSGHYLPSLVGLALAFYKTFYALFIIGIITTIDRVKNKCTKWKWENGVNRWHFHNVFGWYFYFFSLTKKCILYLLMGPNSFSSTICWKGDYICKFRTKVQSHTWKIYSFPWSY
jgi:hypothetical protein